eukprot:scaffold21384_cov36-Prasinocladus_malaysianus.AAC.1
MEPSVGPPRSVRGIFSRVQRFMAGRGGAAGFQLVETELATGSPHFRRAGLSEKEDNPETPHSAELNGPGVSKERSLDTEDGFSHISDWFSEDDSLSPVKKRFTLSFQSPRKWAIRAILWCCLFLAVLIVGALVTLYLMYVRKVDVYVCPADLYDPSQSCSTLGASRYGLYVEYSGEDFLDNWDFRTTDDPTHGTVNYVSRNVAEAQNLTYYDEGNGTWYLRADTQNIVDSWARGRDSIRIESKEVFHEGLFVLDTPHMPTGWVDKCNVCLQHRCGTWPAFWLYNSPWPFKGEIDIVEGVHTATSNNAALHTGNNCTMRHVPTTSFQGVWNPSLTGGSASNCYIKASGQAENQGCSIAFPDKTYGAPWNDEGGGVYAMLWDSEGIKIWVFKRGCLPEDLICGRPMPISWGVPAAHFAFNECNEEHFDALKIVINLTFCGDWAGATWLLDGCIIRG